MAAVTLVLSHIVYDRAQSFTIGQRPLTPKPHYRYAQVTINHKDRRPFYGEVP